MPVFPQLRALYALARKTVGGVPLSDRQLEAFRDDLADTNRRRFRVLLPIMVVLHAIHIGVFWVSPAERAQLDATIIEWRELIIAAHLLAASVSLPVMVSVFRTGSARVMRWLGPLGAANYLLHGAACASIDQLTVAAASPYIGYCVAIAVVQAHTPRSLVVVYGLGLLAFALGISHFQADPAARLAVVPNGYSITLVSVILAWMLYLSRRRAFLQHDIIQTQQAELSRLNTELEARVEAQVSEIVARADEVERLNAQLREQVRDRSAELSVALARLSRRPEAAATMTGGRVLAGRFELGALIGEGGMGSVYEGRDRRTGGAVAVKLVRVPASHELDTLQRFLAEARLAATVSHPAVVRMLHVDVAEDGTLFQVQERVRGEALSARLRPGYRWDASVVARLGETLCDALAAAHGLGVVHRDVKPGNLMLLEDAPGLTLVDFGIAKLVEDARRTDGDRTRTGVFLGTPQYMSPEQLLGESDVDDRADMYAVGVLLFLLLTGGYPRDADTLPQLVQVHRDAEAGLSPPDPRTRVAGLPEALCSLVMQLLAPRREGRPRAAAAAAALARIANAADAPPLHVLAASGRLYDDDLRAHQGVATVRAQQGAATVRAQQGAATVRAKVGMSS